VMRYAPHTTTYFNRDRFVLSNGKYSRAEQVKLMADHWQDTHACSSTHFFILQAIRP
jgi:transketolase N-terminal domain/subunit